MNIEIIKEGLPAEVSDQLMSNEDAFYFTYIAFKGGGCMSSGEKEKYWLALTDRRVLYKTQVSSNEANKLTFVEKDGDLPFNKISFIEVSEGKDSKGCSNKVVFHLRISTSGGTIIIPIPTKNKGFQIRKIYSHLSHKES